MLFWEDMIALLVYLKYYYFYVNIKLLSWIFRIWIFMPQLRRFTLKLCQSITQHQKFYFYHLPTRGRAGIKLGDTWYVSNVSIIFYCSMLLYYLFWMFMGFIIHFYIIFGTNLLTGGPTQNAVFLPISVFEEKEYQMESKWNETSGRVIFGTEVIQETWSRRRGSNEVATRVQGAPYPLGVPPPSWAPRSSPDRLLSPIYIHIPRKHPEAP